MESSTPTGTRSLAGEPIAREMADGGALTSFEGWLEQLEGLSEVVASAIADPGPRTGGAAAAKGIIASRSRARWPPSGLLPLNGST